MRDADGFVAFINENQHVWQFGFDPNDVDQLLVTGECTFGPRAEPRYEWDLVAATPEDALVFTLLVNLSMYGPEAEWDGDVSKPEAAHVALWQHPAWHNSDFDGFWINDERTLIYYSGWRVTRR